MDVLGSRHADVLGALERLETCISELNARSASPDAFESIIELAREFRIEGGGGAGGGAGGAVGGPVREGAGGGESGEGNKAAGGGKKAAGGAVMGSVKKGALLKAVRLCITGGTGGPSVTDVMAALGPTVCARRIRRARLAYAASLAAEPSPLPP